MRKRIIDVFPEIGIALVPLGSYKGIRGHAIIDAADAELVQQYNWCTTTHCGLTYATTSELDPRYPDRSRTRRIQLHRLLMNPPAGMVVDHINHNTLDNRRCNLRVVTHAQNMHNANRRPRGISGYVGVHPYGDRWMAIITMESRNHRLGYFDTPEEAAKAYDAAVAEYRDELAFRNNRA